MYILRNVYKLKPTNSNSFFGALNAIFNRVDKGRIELVGADRACAEWLMKNGAHVRWRGQSEAVKHYNSLPLDPDIQGNFQIEEVIAKEASISHHGFDYFNDCTCITKMTFYDCQYFDDRCVKKLSCILKDSLLCLEIIKCPHICAEALAYLGNLENLQILQLHELEIKNISAHLCELQKQLPNCQINPT